MSKTILRKLPINDMFITSFGTYISHDVVTWLIEFQVSSALLLPVITERSC